MNHSEARALWRLPDGMDEMLPAQARALESLRRSIYDLHLSWGYQPVEPPFVEFLDSLLSGTGRDFERQTFKVADPLSGQMMGVRADMTPQVARIDAHQMAADHVSRLFYLGTVVRAHTDGLEKNRAPLQIGAEIFGHVGPQSDVEVIRLMIATLRCAGIEDIHIDLGHVGVFRSLCAQIGLTELDQSALFSLLQKKAVPDIKNFASSLGLDNATQQMLCRLCSMNGDQAVLERAQAELSLSTGLGSGSAASDQLMRVALDELQQISDLLQPLPSNTTLHFDLAEVRGYQYHTGVVFAAYTPGSGSEIARGGRYDGIGEAFGKARPATGYSTDLKLLMRLVGLDQIATNFNMPSKRAILCPDDNCTKLYQLVDSLRARGEVVIFDLTGLDQSLCDRAIRKNEGVWSVENF